MASQICASVKVHDTAYSLTAEFKNNSGRIIIEMNLYGSPDSDTLLIEFQRTHGDQFRYFQQIKYIKEQYLRPLVERKC